MADEKAWKLPYEVDEKYSKKVAYFCMEFGIDQALKIYSGGLGFLAGSHMKSAYSLKQNMVAVGMLWKFGYYDQVRDEQNHMTAKFIKKYYNYLEDTDIKVKITINNNPVYVKALYLPPDIFHTVPIYLLTTDLPENDYLARTITQRLYDPNPLTRIAQKIVLGIGGAKVIDEIGGAEVYHMNEAHPLPLCFHLYNKFGSWDEVRKHCVFTTHTPERAGNEENNFNDLIVMDFFGEVSPTEVRNATKTEGNTFNHTAAALHLVREANGVSEIHARVANEMWQHLSIPEIKGVTNAQNRGFWIDKKLQDAFENRDKEALEHRKKEMKKQLFKVVADQCGKIFDPDVLTIVWARRFAEYKRPNLVLRDVDRFLKMINNEERPVQIIWAGKPYPEDYKMMDLFNYLIDFTYHQKHAAVVTGYEIFLSRLLKQGADVWLNNPRRPREASGTSGMSAAKNATVNFSISDGWIPEFARHGENSFILPIADENAPISEQDNFDAQNIYQILENEIIPVYYGQPDKWWDIVIESMKDVSPKFHSDRMADEYYRKMY